MEWPTSSGTRACEVPVVGGVVIFHDPSSRSQNGCFEDSPKFAPAKISPYTVDHISSLSALVRWVQES